ncbi:MAG: hypothetical protein ACC669_04495 [bacterium]
MPILERALEAVCRILWSSDFRALSRNGIPPHPRSRQIEMVSLRQVT